MTIAYGTRTRSAILQPAQYEQLWTAYTVGPGTDHYEPLVCLTAYSEKSMTDVVTENYAQRIKAGEVINNPCQYSVEETYSSGEGFASYSNDGGTTSYTHTGPLTEFRWVTDKLSSQAWTSVDIGLADDKAGSKLRCLAAIDSTPYAFGEDVLELRETIRFLRNPLQGILRATRTFKKAADKVAKNHNRRTRRRGLEQKYGKQQVASWKLFQPPHIKHNNPYDLPKQGIRDLNDLYLQWRFAVSPLLRSISDIIDAYMSKPTKLPVRLTAHGRWEDENSDQSTLTQSGRVYDFTAKRTGSGHASILYEVSNPVQDWKKLLGFRAKDWPTTFWQVVPFSFLVDRFFNISAFLAGLINLGDPNVKILSGSYTSKQEEVFSYRLDSQSVTGWTAVVSAETVYKRNFAYEREVWKPNVGDLVPGFTPGYAVKDILYIADLVGLILSFLLRK